MKSFKLHFLGGLSMQAVKVRDASGKGLSSTDPLVRVASYLLLTAFGRRFLFSLEAFAQPVRLFPQELRSV